VQYLSCCQRKQAAGSGTTCRVREPNFDVKKKNKDLHTQVIALVYLACLRSSLIITKMLILLILIPIIGTLFILPMSETNSQNVSQMKKIALGSTILNFFISLFIWYNFDSNTTQYQFVSSLDLQATDTLQFCHLNFGIDGISLFFVLLTTFVSPIAILSNYNNILIGEVVLAKKPKQENKILDLLKQANVKLFLVSLLLLESLQICAFVSLDLLLFYIFFESVLPILFIVIIIFGHGMDRFRSAFLLFLYTLAGSLPMLLSILMIYNYIGSTDFQLISLIEISLESQKLLWLGFFIAFAVKTPLYPFIIWLPKAHSDSPLAGSILLAATILKLATYGYLRVLIQILPDATHYFSPLIQSIAIISLIYASFSTIVQQDTKRLIAYSSVCHMAVVVLGLFSNTIQGIEGAILLGIAHGFVSPALFICVGGIIYDRTGTRIIKYIRGLATYMPVFTILFFIFTLANTGIPLTLNFLGEQLSLIGIWQQNPIIAALGATGIVFSAIYSLFLYNRLSYGNYSPYLITSKEPKHNQSVTQITSVADAIATQQPVKDINRREYFLLIALLIPTVILGLFPNVLLEALHLSVSSLLYIV
jgi:NADH-ubiquinone oxidoreductase chain 4